MIFLETKLKSAHTANNLNVICADFASVVGLGLYIRLKLTFLGGP